MVVERPSDELDMLGPARQYRDTIVKDGARAHLGGVNFDGGIHFHLPTQPTMSALAPLTGAAVAVHAVTLLEHFLTIGSECSTAKPNWEIVTGFERFSRSLGRLKADWNGSTEVYTVTSPFGASQNVGAPSYYQYGKH